MPRRAVRRGKACAFCSLSLAVLRLHQYGGDHQQDYFVDGVTENLTTDLSRIGALRHRAQHRLRHKDKRIDVRVIGRDLGVRYVLEGSVRKAGNRVRVTGQLIDAESGAHIWADRFDRDLTDIFAVQDELTREIIAALKIKLSEAEKALIVGSSTNNEDAHDFFLRGREALYRPKRDREMFMKRPRVSGEPLSSIRTMPHRTRASVSRTYWIISITGAIRPRTHCPRPSV